MEKTIGYICVNIVRKEATKKCILSLKKYCPFVQIYIADQDEQTEEMLAFYKENDVKYYFVEYDWGLSNARNFLLDKITEPYLMWGDNDFVFNENNGLLNAIELIKKNKKIGFVGGSLFIKDSLQHYERELFYDDKKGLLIYVPLELTEPEIHYINNLPYYYTDLTFNYVLSKTSLIRSNKKLRWNSDLKVAFEHTDMFLRIKLYSHRRVVYFPSMQVIHEPMRTEAYKPLRRRINCGEIFGKAWNLKMALGVSGTKITYKTQETSKIPKTPETLIQNQIQTVKQDNTPELTNCFDILNQLNITYWLLESSCVELVVNKKIPFSNIMIGVPDTKTQQLIKNLNLNICVIIEPNRKRTLLDFEDKSFYVPSPITEYVDKFLPKPNKTTEIPITELSNSEKMLIELNSICEPYNIDFCLIDDTCLRYVKHELFHTALKIACKNQLLKEVLLNNNFQEIAGDTYTKNDITIIISHKMPQETKWGKELNTVKFKIPYPVVKYLEKVFGNEWKTK